MTYRSNAFHLCTACDGAGFLRAGDFADRKFPRCSACDGCGQVYLDPIPEAPPEKVTALASDPDAMFDRCMAGDTVALTWWLRPHRTPIDDWLEF